MSFDAMLFDLFSMHFSRSTSILVGASLWSLAFYLVLPQLVEWTTDGLTRWFNFAERSLYTSQREFEATRSVRESVNAFYASLISTVPFLILGVGVYCFAQTYLGTTRTILFAMFCCVLGLLHEMRRDAGPSSL
jgi:hypothetical protein